MSKPVWTKETLQEEVDRLGPWHYCHQFPFGVVTGTSKPDQVPSKINDLVRHSAFLRRRYPKVLDLGANSGLISMWFVDNKKSEVTAVEFGPKYYPQLELAVEVKGYSESIIPVKQSILDCDFGQMEYDLVLLLGVMHHLPSEKHVDILRACKKALLPSGEIVIQTKPEFPVLQQLTRAGFILPCKLYDAIEGRSAWQGLKDAMKVE